MRQPLTRPAPSAAPFRLTRSPGVLRWCPRLSALPMLALLAACSGGDGPSEPEPRPVPAIAVVSPDTVVRGSAEATLAVTGSNFARESVVRLNGADRPTEFVSANRLDVRLSAADLAAAAVAQVTVFTPQPGGGASNAAEFVVANPVPEFTSVSRSTVEVGSPNITVTVTGAKFVPETIVWGPRGQWPSTYLSPTQLSVGLTAEDFRETGIVIIYVSNPEPGGGSTSSGPIQVVNPAPTLTAISPTFVPVRSPATVTLTGTGFSLRSRVRIGNDILRMPTFASATQLQVPLTAADVGTSGTLVFSVENLAPGGGVSGTAALEVRAPVPTVTSLLESTTTAGQASYTLYVNGTGFVDNSVVRFGGVARPTQANSATQLWATLSAADLATPGTFAVDVFSPAPGGGLSNAVSFVVASPVPAITRAPVN